MSNFVEGQGILGKIRFVDGELPEYNRTYLIINVTSEYIEVLNVSSIRGKERKLAFSTNERLRSFKPPFLLLTGSNNMLKFAIFCIGSSSEQK